MRLSRTVTLQSEMHVGAGAVIAGRVLNDKNTYNQIEDVHGRFSAVQKGDIVVGALGHRNALHGYEGVLPESLAVGQTIHLLNMGGVMGHCLSNNPDVGPPFELEVLGQLQRFPESHHRIGVPANIKDVALTGHPGASAVPIVLIAGTCMNAGKTAAACCLVRSLARAGFIVGGAKLTGVSLQRDILSMVDYGAEHAFDFTDVGVTSSNMETAVHSAEVIFSELAQKGCTVIVCETGDGILGEYGVQAILAHEATRQNTAAFVLCANDPVGVVGGVNELRESYGIEVDVVTGPATDNRVGTRFVEEKVGVRALNARVQGAELSQFVLEKVRGRA